MINAKLDAIIDALAAQGMMSDQGKSETPKKKFWGRKKVTF